MEAQKRSERMDGQVSDQGLADLIRIKSLHDEAYLYISQAIDYEEQNKIYFALEMYQKGKARLEDALNIRCDRRYCTGPNWEGARKMQHKMRQSLQQAKERLAILENNTQEEQTSLETPPTYEEACSNFNSNQPTTKVEYGAKPLNRTESVIVEEIFVIPDGVQIFNVSADGNSVTSSGNITSLHIYKFKDGGQQTLAANGVQRPPAWLQIGDWTFPLLPGQSPALRSGYGAYFFPDVENEMPGSTVGVILPGHSDNIGLREQFEHYLVELTLLECEDLISDESDVELVQPTTDDGGKRPAKFEQLRTSDKISNYVVAGAELVSKGLVKGAEATGQLVHYGATKIRNSLIPEHQPVVVDPRLQRSLSNLRSASGAARKVSGFVVGKLGELTMVLAKQMAPHIKEQGSRVLVSTGLVHRDTVDAKNPESPINDAMVVACGGLRGFATVYMGLEAAARTLAFSLANETVQTVQHKHYH